jgi:polyhydroxybutyrate depolymerase
MRNRAAFLLTLMLLLSGAARSANAASCSGMPGPSKTVELQVGGVTRMFVVRLPPGYDATSHAPVVFAFHPFGMNVQYMQGRVPVSTAWPDAIAVYPQALPGAGRSGFQPAWQSAPGELGNRDVAFFDAMREWLQANHCVDDKRLFVMGYSNGARLSGVLACERPGAIAGLAIASGSLACSPAQPLPVTISHGINDSTIRYEQAVETVRTWASRNGCKGPPKTGEVGCFVGESCAAAPVTLCTYDGGHEYNAPFTGTIVEFFKSAPKR